MQQHRDLIDGPSEIVRDAMLVVSCIWCEKLHRAEHALQLNRVCGTCAARHRIMRTLEMSGSYPLSDEAIDDAVMRRSPGNYALGYLEDDVFRVFFVGRSDSDVGRRLHEWVGMPSRSERFASQAKASWGVRHRGSFPVNAPALGAVATADTSYTRFAYSYAPSAATAFERECRNYDDFGGNGELDNEAPPTSARI